MSSALIWNILLVLFGTVSFCCATVSDYRVEGHFKCPPVLEKILDNCGNFKCENVVSKELCPPDTIYMHNFSLCRCCPACVRFLKPDDEKKSCVTGDIESDVTWTLDPTCDPEDNYCPVEINKCLPGLVCDTNAASVDFMNKCKLPQLNPPESESCMYRKSLYRLGLHHWDPQCEADGSFSPKQCKGTHYSGECFCVNQLGTRIFGREWRIQAENQTCGEVKWTCSRKVAELRSQGFISTLHCTPDGNFEPLQCDTDSGLCYCVEPRTGELLGPVVPETQWKLLPCYSMNITNGSLDGNVSNPGKYLRICDSEYGAKALEIESGYHGGKLEMRRLNCEYDGSYSPVLETSTRSECVYKNGTRIGNYIRLNSVEMNCACARDVNEYFPSHEHPRKWACQQDTGNYDIALDFGSYSSCIDIDGFLYGDVVESKYICCLLDECPPQTKADCYVSETNLQGGRPCKWWPYRN